MKMFSLKFYTCILLSVFFLIALRRQLFFLSQGILGRDWPYFYPEQLSVLPVIPYAWQTHIGLGGPQLSPWIDTYLYVIVNIFVKGLHLPWGTVLVVFFFVIAILISIFSSLFLSKIFLGKYAPITPLIYTTNTYFLLILSGGQLGVALSFATAPLVFACFVQTIRILLDGSQMIPRSAIQWLVYLSLALALQMLFDPRITYVTIGGMVVYAVAYFFLFKKHTLIKFLRSLIISLVIPLFVSVLLHSFWILPLFLSGVTKSIGFTEAIRGVSAITFYSFGSFSQSLSFLHPNWPENIFGKTYFLRAEFLLLPIFVFSGLIFLLKDQKHRPKDNLVQRNDQPLAEKAILIPLYLVALVGIFLSKGTNEPFGELYVWFYENVPGFVFFRDPTKFYVLIGLAYSILIPYFLSQASLLLSQNWKARRIYFYVLVLFGIFWLFTLRDVVVGEVQSTRSSGDVPREYVQLKNFLVQDTSFSRTLWIPGTEHFMFYSAAHPAVSAIDYFDMYEPEQIALLLSQTSVKDALRLSGVKYIVVPFDTEGRLFQADRKYDDKKYQHTVAILKNTPELSLVKRFGKIVVFSIPGGKDKFFYQNSEDQLDWFMISPVVYHISAIDTTSFIFSESFNTNWRAKADNEVVRAENYKNLNRFTFSKPYDSIQVYFGTQQYVFVGVVVSIATVFSLVFVFIHYRKKTE